MVFNRMRDDCPPRDYRTITINLPNVGLPNMPPQIFFRVDARFNDAQFARLQAMTARIILAWALHSNQYRNTGTSQLMGCSQKYAIRGFTPIWYIGRPTTNGAQGAVLTMDLLTELLRRNGFGINIDYICYAPGVETVCTTTTRSNATMTLTTRINPAFINRSDVGVEIMTGSLLHAWMNGMGYRNPPTNNYTGYLVGELPYCVVRGYQDKNPNVPDSRFWQFLEDCGIASKRDCCCRKRL